MAKERAQVEVCQKGSRIEPDRGAVFGDGQVELALAVERLAEVEVGVGVAGLPPDRLTSDDLRGLESLRRFSGQPPFFEQSAQAVKMAGVAGA